MCHQGTTGAPKGATLTHFNIVNNAYFVGRRVGYHWRVSPTWITREWSETFITLIRPKSVTQRAETFLETLSKVEFNHTAEPQKEQTSNQLIWLMSTVKILFLCGIQEVFDKFMARGWRSKVWKNYHIYFPNIVTAYIYTMSPAVVEH